MKQQRSSAIWVFTGYFHLSQILPSACINTGPMKTGHHRPRSFLYEPRKNFKFGRANAQIDTP
jgi:hypothetical protein